MKDLSPLKLERPNGKEDELGLRLGLVCRSLKCWSLIVEYGLNSYQVSPQIMLSVKGRGNKNSLIRLQWCFWW